LAYLKGETKSGLTTVWDEFNDRLGRVHQKKLTFFRILSKKCHSCACVVPEFLAHPAPQSHLVGLRKVVKHPLVRYTAAVILNSIISTKNIVDAVAMQYTSTPPHFHTSTNHDDKISRDQDVGFPSSFRSNTSHYLEEEQAKLQHIAAYYSIFWTNLLANLMFPAAR
jgi:hypothetical protein